jgi:hypothetical protein
MLYSMKTTEATAAVPRVVDAHSLLHQRASKAAKACDAADVVDGLAVLQNLTLRLVAAAYGVSMSSVVHARRLTPEQRQAVKRSKRPLVLPRTPAAPPVPAIVPASVPPVMEVEKLLAAAVGMVGVNGVLDLLAAKERIAA